MHVMNGTQRQKFATKQDSSYSTLSVGSYQIKSIKRKKLWT